MSVFFRPSSIEDRPITIPKSEYDALTGKVETLAEENAEIKAQMAVLLGIEEGAV